MKKMDPRLTMGVSMAVFGTLGLFTRYITVTSGELALYRAILAAALILAYLKLSGQRMELRGIKRQIPLLLLSGAAMGVNWILLFQAYRYTTISSATLSYYFAPVIVTVACPILFGEKLGPRQIICFAMSTIGLVMIIGVGAVAGLKGILFGLGAAVFYAAVILINKFIKGVEGIYRTLWQFIAAIVTLIPYVALSGGVTISGMTVAGWVCLAIVGFVHTGATYCMYFSSLKELPGHKAAMLSYIDPLVAVLVSVLLGEEMTVWQGMGGIMILGFTLWNEFASENGR